MRSRNTLIIVGSILLLAAYLMGFFPQYRRASALQESLDQAEARLQTLERSASLHRARELAHTIHLESARKNYGLAAKHAETFFNHVQTVHGEVQDPGMQSGLREVYEQREAVISDLSQAAPTADERVRQLVDRVNSLTQSVQ